jgi:hypothetical protein
MELRIDGPAALVEAVEKGNIDAALVVGHHDRPTAELLGEIELGWIASPEFVLRPGQPLPLAMLGPQCAFRQAAIARLDGAERPWRIAAVSPSIGGLWASALGGLGLTARTPLGLPPHLVWDKDLFELPRLGSFPVTLHRISGVRNPALDRFCALVRDGVRSTLGEAAVRVRGPREALAVSR